MKVIAGEWLHYGGGKLFMDVDSIAAACEILVDCQHGGSASITGSFSSTMNLRVIRGGTPEAPVEIAAGFGAASLLDVGFRGSRGTDTYVNIASGAGALTELNVWGGQLISYNNITDAFIAAGLLRTMGSGTMGTLRVMPTGRADYFSSGAFTLIKNAGRVNFLKRGTAQSGTDLTRYPGSTMDYDSNLLTVTNGIKDLRRT